MTAGLLIGAAVWVLQRPSVRLCNELGGRRPTTAVSLLVVALALVGGAAGAAAPFALALVLTGATCGARVLWRQRLLARSVVETQERVLECCALLASELGAGQPPEAALAHAAETWPGLRPVSQSHSYASDVPAALRRAAAEPGAEGLALVAAAWHVSHRTGVGLADALARVAQTLREARATERVVRSELASARATARLVAALPFVALLIGAGSGGNPVGFLLLTPAGIACLACGIGLGLSGLVWIERIAAGIGR